MKTMMNLRMLLAMTFSLVSFTAFSGEKIDKMLEVSAQGEIEIHNNRGQISVKGWDKSQVVIKGELDDLAEKFIFSTNGNKTIIKVVLPDRNVSARSGSGSDLKIFVPMNSSVLFGGVATDINFSKIYNGLEVSSVSGDIKINDTKKRTYINSVSGDIKLRRVSGNIEISTVSGDVDAKVDANKINIGGVSSDIVVKTKDIDFAKLSTVSGDTMLFGQLLKDGEIKLSNVSGDSHFYVIGELNALVDLETGPGGDVSNQYSSHKPTSSFIGSEKLKFTAGNGDGSIRMSTVSGSIGLKGKN